MFINHFFLLLLFVSALGLAACDRQPPPPTISSPPLQPGEAVRGAALFSGPLIGGANAPGCSTCHSLEPGFVLVGPTLAGVGRRAADTVQQSTYTGAAEDAAAYLQEAISAPDVYVVDGFVPGLMPTQYGSQLSPQEIADLVAYLLSLE